MKIVFKVAKNADLRVYGFVKEDKEWILWRRTRRLWVGLDRLLHFNSLTNEVLKVFYQMIKDNIVEYKEVPNNKAMYHYVTLSDEEFEQLKKKRGEL